MCILYLRPPRRRPVWVGPRLGFRDHQGEIPRSWCQSCGAEVFLEGAVLCPKCEKEKYDGMYEKLCQPL